MIRLSAFADEISPDIGAQLAVLRSEGIRHIDLRSAWDTNVLDLTDQQVEDIDKILRDADMGVAAIGSPIGKVPVDHPFDEHLQRFERALALARIFKTSFVRVFSFYPAAETAMDREAYLGEVLKRLRTMAERAEQSDIVLLHENEKDIYGDTAARCVELLESVSNPHFQAAFDPANFIQCGETVYPDAYEALRPWAAYIHVKDARLDGSVVPAGEGAVGWSELLHRLRNDGYDGFLSLEPHLAAAGKFQGFSGPDLFARASQALQLLLREMNWSYA